MLAPLTNCWQTTAETCYLQWKPQSTKMAGLYGSAVPTIVTRARRESVIHHIVLMLKIFPARLCFGLNRWKQTEQVIYASPKWKHKISKQALFLPLDTILGRKLAGLFLIFIRLDMPTFSKDDWWSSLIVLTWGLSAVGYRVTWLHGLEEQFWEMMVVVDLVSFSPFSQVIVLVLISLIRIIWQKHGTRG